MSAASGVIADGTGWRVSMDARVYGAVGPSVPDLLRLAPQLRLAAGANDPMVTRDAMCAIDPAARTIAGAGHNMHWEAPAAVWDFVNNKH